jgi:aldehyde dehydrogenase (NAD+)
VGAIAAGNTVVLKPSELTPNTSKITKEIIEAVFDKNHVSVIEGGVDTSTNLLEQRWDYIFFTGSVQVGKIVAKAAAQFLTPVTLELGGKNPCIIDETANIKLAAKRIVWGKFINGGQTCIAPDYILIHASVKDKFTTCFQAEVTKAYGENPETSKDYPRIVNQRNFDRLTIMLKNQKILIGGLTNREDNYIAPTLIDEPSLDSEIMKGEIFGPISPVISYNNKEDLHKIISNYEKPLALYVFTGKNSFAKKMIAKYSFGGGTINDTTVHFANHNLPFGGVGESGIGGYHGKQTFDLFSHKKGIVKRYNWLDIPVRYAPYNGKLNILKTFMKYFS